MKRVFFLDQYGKIGGAQTVLLQLMALFQKNKWNVQAAFPLGYELERRAHELGALELFSLSETELTKGKKNWIDALKLLPMARDVWRLRNFLHKADIVYVNGPRLFLLVALACVGTKAKVIYHIHLDHTDGQKKIIYELLRAKQTRLVIANSSYTYEKLIKKYPDLKNEPRFVVVRNSLSPKFSEHAFRPPTRFAENLRFVTIGRIMPEKGQALILEAAKQFPQNKFYLVSGADLSSSNYAAQLKKQAPDNLIWSDEVSDVASFIRDEEISAAIVASQSPESFGLVAIEAVASSCALLTTMQGELKNIAIDAGAATFSSVDELVKQVKTLCEMNQEELTRTIHLQWEKTNSGFTPARFESEILSLVESVL